MSGSDPEEPSESDRSDLRTGTGALSEARPVLPAPCPQDWQTPALLKPPQCRQWGGTAVADEQFETLPGGPCASDALIRALGTAMALVVSAFGEGFTDDMVPWAVCDVCAAHGAWR